MKIVVFGATGGTGRHVIEQALAQGHDLTAFVRNAEALAMRHDRLRVIVGDSTGDPARIEAAIREQDVVVSALGRRNSLRSDGLITKSLAAIIPAMERAGVRRIFLVSAHGVGESGRNAPLVPRIMYKLLLAGLFADKKSAGDALRASGLDWTIMYPVMLTDGLVTGRYRVGEVLQLSGMPKIARADVAHFIVSQLESDTWLRKGAVISY